MKIDAPRVRVVVGVLVTNNRVLVALRPAHLHQGGLWEFPGGKVEPNETAEDALCRELSEEVGIVPRRSRPLISIPYDYPDKKVLLDVWLVSKWDGCARGLEGQPIDWCDLRQLDSRQFPAANRAIINALQLAPSYAITPELAELASFGVDTIASKLHGEPIMVQLRSKSLAFTDIRGLLRKLDEVPGRATSKLIVNSAIRHWQDLEEADGVHLTSLDLMSLRKRPTPREKLTGASCHSREQLRHACHLGLDFCVLSPVKTTRSHPSAEPLGWAKFADLVSQVDLPVYALGGLSSEDTDIAHRHGAQGVAGISGFFTEFFC